MRLCDLQFAFAHENLKKKDFFSSTCVKAKHESELLVKKLETFLSNYEND